MAPLRAATEIIVTASAWVAVTVLLVTVAWNSGTKPPASGKSTRMARAAAELYVTVLLSIRYLDCDVCPSWVPWNAMIAWLVALTGDVTVLFWIVASSNEEAVPWPATCPTKIATPPNPEIVLPSASAGPPISTLASAFPPFEMTTPSLPWVPRVMVLL